MITTTSADSWIRDCGDCDTDLRITDLDVNLTQPSHEAPGFHRLYLKLSDEPPREWVEAFEQERRFVRRPTWRRAWVIGSHIVVECMPEELENFQLNHLKEDVAKANMTYKETIAKKTAETLRQEGEREVTRLELERLRARLDFD